MPRNVENAHWLHPAQAIEQSGVDVVPKIMIGGSTSGNGNGQGAGSSMSGNVMEALLAMLLSDKVGVDLGSAAAQSPRNPQAERLRSELYKGMNGE